MRKCGLILTAAVVLVVGTTGTAGAVAPSPAGASGQPAAGVAGSSAGKPAKKAKRKALRKCRKIKERSRRKSCIRRVKKKYAASKRASATGETFVIDVRDKYFNPDAIEIRAGDSLLWYWNPVNADAHNVNLVTGPSGVDRIDFATPSSPAVGFKFRRTFTVPGTYHFACSIHQLMTMTVEVSK